MIVVKIDNSVRDQAFSHCLPGLDTGTLNQTYFHLFMSVLVMCIC